MAIEINEKLYSDIGRYVGETWPGKKVKCNLSPRLNDRYIQVMTAIKDMDIHYEIIHSHLQLHFERKFAKKEFFPLRNFLMGRIPSDERFKWGKWIRLNYGLCQMEMEINDWDELKSCLNEMIGKFDTLIVEFVDANPNLFPNQYIPKETPRLSYKLNDKPQNIFLEHAITVVKDLPFDEFTIPPYQRPYKWTAKNVNQLINDLLTFKDKSSYRLGTLVLHRNVGGSSHVNLEIVDGQQRMVTLCLLIIRMYKWFDEDTRLRVNKTFIDNVRKFSQNITFQNKYSLHNVVENIHVIEARKSDLDFELFDFLIKKCEFVVIKLGDISEAFQFFDSQNARGKDLAAHDLLKAYHLREIENLSADDSRNIDFWQKERTEFLHEIFLTMFRSKQWPLGKSAVFFTKDDIDTFKGISISDGKRYPFYQKEIIAHVFAQLYRNDMTRLVDKAQFEYPFNLDSQIINGSRFFDMVRHYMSLYKSVINPETYREYANSWEIIQALCNYPGMGRIGDQYVRSMFNALVFYYIDRFGYEELDKVIPKFFIWAYTLRLKSHTVQQISMDNWAKGPDSMFKIVHDAKTPYDIINLSQKPISRQDLNGSKCERLTAIFDKFNKLY